MGERRGCEEGRKGKMRLCVCAGREEGGGRNEKVKIVCVCVRKGKKEVQKRKEVYKKSLCWKIGRRRCKE